MVTTTQPADDILVGTIDGTRFRLEPSYRGTLNRGERARVLRSSADYVTSVLRDQRPGKRAPGTGPVAAYRRAFADLLWLSLSLGFAPSDLAATCRAVGDALAIDRADVRELIEELRAVIERYSDVAEVQPEPFAWSCAR
jgi:hypothetical protein